MKVRDSKVAKTENENMEESLKDNEEQKPEAAEENTSSAEEIAEESNEDKIKELEDKYMRLFAEFDNYKKRTAKEKDARYADAVIDTVAAFLPVADNLERAQSVAVENEEAKKVLEGVSMVMKQFNDTLSKLEVSEIPAVGEEFDPNVHEAIMHIEDENKTENVIVEEFMKGYIYKKDRVVRHSMVKVAN